MPYTATEQKDKTIMSEPPKDTPETPTVSQTDFERISTIIYAEFQVDEALLEYGLPTYRLKEPQETKQAFLKVLGNLKPMHLIAILRRIDGKVVLKVVPEPQVKPSNVLVNWALFFATIATTFYTGYVLSLELVDRGVMSDPFIGAAMFVVAIMAVLGTHEMGHKLTANKNKMEATLPYFIPGLPPNMGGFGTFGAVIMQKSLPPNRDALFDIGSSGPIVGFVLALVASIVGLLISPIYPLTGTESGFLPVPIIFELFFVYMVRLPSGFYIMAHPVALAGWVGMIVTMLNLLPAGQLDGGHVARSVLGKSSIVFTVLSFLYLIIIGAYPMAIFLLFISMYKHPGPLDDVSSLSTGRKILTLGLVAIFVLCSFPLLPLF
jgi:membrane-associated protease RseP (regulator of RpoE activity)